jgi:hypothetical protein
VKKLSYSTSTAFSGSPWTEARVLETVREFIPGPAVIAITGMSLTLAMLSRRAPN